MANGGLPTGTVTFLLTDVEGSTRRWESDADAMALAIARHYAILDLAIAEAGGVRPVEQGEGDSVVGAFVRASDALAAAVAAQRAFAAEAWPIGAELRVRMAIHTGDARMRDEGNYFGPAIIRCARLRSCASGGQVLVSRATVELLADHGLPGVSLANLGLHRLKDLEQPEEIWQAVIDGLANDFAPLAAIDAARPNLPAQSSPLIGRAAELDELTDLAASERLVTLTGSGGCGKTRLAVELAGRLLTEFPGGVTWIELAPHGEVDAIVSSLAIAFDVVESPGERLIDRVVNALRRREAILVVMDNAEHLLDATADIATALLQIDHVTVVVTSREPLGLPGEVVWRVPSLSTPGSDPEGSPTADSASADALAGFEAVQLFVDRARRARRGFELTDHNAPAVAQICRRLDGVPLAIELAAARVRTMPPERIAAQLDDRFRLLAGGSRTALPRQQTLLASIAWSEGLLDDVDRAVFWRLGVFIGGFTIEAAQSVIASGMDVDADTIDDAITRLVDKSLVQFDEERDRFLLLETIRSYALDRLIDLGVAASMRDAHAAWYVEWLERHTSTWINADSISQWARLRLVGTAAIEVERANCIGALEWVEPGSSASLGLVAGMAECWLLRRGSEESLRHGMPALRLGDRTDRAWLAAFIALHGVRTNSLDPDYDAMKSEALAVAEAVGDERAATRIRVLLPMSEMWSQGPTDELLAAMQTGLQLALAVGEWYAAWNLTQQCANFLQIAGRIDESRRLLKGYEASRALLIESSCDQAQGNMQRSADLLRSVHRMIASGDRSEVEWAFFELRVRSLVLMSGWVEIGEQLALPGHSSDIDYPSAMRYMYHWSSGLRHLEAGELAEARDAFATHDTRNFQTVRGVCFAVQVDMALGDHAAAAGRLATIRARSSHLDAPLLETIADLVAAELAWSTDRIEALRLTHLALASALRAGLWPSVVDALEAIAVLELEAGNREVAVRLLNAAADGRDAMTYRYRFAHRAAAVAAARDALTGDSGHRVPTSSSLAETAAWVISR